MKRSIQVFMGDTHVGKLYFNAEANRENSAFEYEGSWIESSKKFSIDPLLPLIRGPQFPPKIKDASPFHPVIADTEPDGWGRKVILRDHAKRKQSVSNQKSSSNLTSLDFLLSVDDVSRVGALRFKDENQIFQRHLEDGERGIPPHIKLAQLVRSSQAIETHTETEADLNFLRGKGTSLGGLRPKCVIIDDSGQMFIAKFPSVQDERAVTKGEVLAMQLAKLAGINTSKTDLVMSDGIPITLIHRFDRKKNGARIPYVSAATLLGVTADQDLHTYTEFVDTLRIRSEDAETDIEELWRRIAFSILITNVDDHLHNHGFLHHSGELWRLSPAFDLNPFPDRMREFKTWISEETGPEASIEALISVLPYFRIEKSKARSILKKVENSIKQWRSLGKKLGFSINELEQFADAFEHKEREKCRKFLSRE